MLNPKIEKWLHRQGDTASKARRKTKTTPEISCGAAIELKNGKIITGKNSSLMSASASLVLNAIKELAGIPDKIHLLSPHILEHIANLKTDILELKREILDLQETLTALSISAATNPTAEKL